MYVCSIFNNIEDFRIGQRERSEAPRLPLLTSRRVKKLDRLPLLNRNCWKEFNGVLIAAERKVHFAAPDDDQLRTHANVSDSEPGVLMNMPTQRGAHMQFLTS